MLGNVDKNDLGTRDYHDAEHRIVGDDGAVARFQAGARDFTRADRRNQAAVPIGT